MGLCMLETEVLVVGAGPTGATASLLLARHGIRTLMVSQSAWVADSPRAHIVNQRTMEVMRAIGLEDVCEAAAAPGTAMANHVMMTAVNGVEFGRMWTWQQDPSRLGEYAAASPCRGCDLPQHRFEPILVGEAARLGARVQYRTRFVSLEQDDDGVTTILEDLDTGQQYPVRSRYVIGADGGQSPVADAIGLELEGTSGIGRALNVVFDADLTKYFEHRQGSIFWILQPGRESGMTNAMLRMVTPWTQWVVGFVHLGDRVADLSFEALRAEVAELIQDDSVDITIRGVYPWRINHVIAKRYQVGRVICGGDAVHRHPPMNGLGSNTCIQDAFNLAWKLAAVLRWGASESLLETYSDERRPVGKQVVDRAIASWRQNPDVIRSLGIDAQAPAAVRQAQFEELFEDSPAGEARRAAFQAAKRSKDYSYHAHGVEMNHFYESAAVLDDGEGPIEFERDPELHFQPMFRAGARLPHVWVGRGGDTTTAPISTLDLTGPERFTLITRVRGTAWLDAAARVSEKLGVPISAVRIGLGGEIADLYGEFGERCGFGEDGAILVRPDQHIAWRVTSAPGDPEAELESALRAILAR